MGIVDSNCREAVYEAMEFRDLALVGHSVLYCELFGGR